MKWRKTMKGNGFELSTYSKAIQSEARRIEELTNQKNDLRKQLNAEPSEELEQEFSELEEGIDQLDNDLVAKINKYDNNREHYAKLGEKLKESREAKKQAKADPAPTPAPDPTPNPDPAPVPDPAPAADPEPEPKKKGGGGWIIAGALLVVGSIIGVNLMKKK
jgi:uncharacterized coiled-coil protein SlyX